MEDPRDPPPTLTSIDSYLLSLTGKAGRNRIADRLAARGLRLWHMAVLAALADFGPHAQRDLSARLGVDPSDMAKIVDQLADGGHVARTRDAADRRRVLIDIADQGRILLRDLMRDAAEVDRLLLAALTPAEQARFHTLLLKVFTAVRATPD
ncbi:MarR family winged helix-turn-helix transcriptional regulator [Catellatospora tritici]|uniref:MarR family winged helix-turn-helix transcriptional regulator n=1 Tax=Catellatospora tritici TaxID=2851566 RepID=UPI001C2DB0B8|nr:MarR family winged helix-turn-helix transcriptional regulator [Catellatospora tritici]MBV1856453.1 MarR family winged helix-turn-helix transcriptional regulator [Catellatospora tritici]